MLTKYYDVISKCQLFHNISNQEIIKICDALKANIFSFKKGELIVDEGAPCDTVSIILIGKVELHTFFISGDVSSLITLNPSHVFGEAILFSQENKYPISATAITQTEILRLRKKDVLRLMESHPLFLENYLGLLSKKLLFLNDKFKLLSLSTIRGKIAHVLIKLTKEQNSMTINLPFSKEKMALHICTRRPSLSRELSKMKSEGLIDYEKSKIKILDYEGLSSELY